MVSIIRTRPSFLSVWPKSSSFPMRIFAPSAHVSFRAPRAIPTPCLGFPPMPPMTRFDALGGGRCATPIPTGCLPAASPKRRSSWRKSGWSTSIERGKRSVRTAPMRIATYNIEWFNGLFDDDGQLLEDAEWSARYKVTRAEQITAIGIVLTALNADAIMIIEAPDQSRHRSSVRALEGFAAKMGLRARRAVMGFENDTQQEIAALYDPDVLTLAHDPRGEATGAAPRFDGVFRIDLDVDATEDVVQFSKPPLELAARSASGTEFR